MHGQDRDVASPLDVARADAFMPSGTNCSGPTNEGPFLPAVPGNAPRFDGGRVLDGTYRLVGFLITQGTTPTMYRRTTRIEGNRIEETVEIANGTMPPHVSATFSGTWSAAGTTLRVQRTCGSNLELVFQYTATPDRLVMMLDGYVFNYLRI